MTEIVTVRGDGLTLDLLLWRRYGTRGLMLVEQALALNPTLAGLPLILPLGTAVTLPALPAISGEAATPKRIDLFEALR